MKRILLFTGILLFAMLQFSNAQVGKNLLNKAKNKATEKLEKKAEEKVEKKVDNILDKALDKGIEKLDENSNSGSDGTVHTEDAQYENSGNTGKNTGNNNNADVDRANRLLQKLGGGEAIKTEKSYSFDALILYEMENHEDGELQSKGTYASYVNSKNNNMGLETKDDLTNTTGLIIMDQANKALITISDEKGQKRGIVIPLMEDVNPLDTIENIYDDEEYYDNEDQVRLELNYKKTGRTKKILGYTCYEYFAENEELESRIWTTNDLNIQQKGILEKLFSMGDTGDYGSGVYPAGFIMENESVGKLDNSSFKMVIKEITENTSKVIDISGYPMINTGSIDLGY